LGVFRLGADCFYSFHEALAMAVSKKNVVTRRIFVSMPADEWLAPNQNDLKWGIVKEIERLHYTPEIFLDPRWKAGLAPRGKVGLAAGKAWSAAEADKVIRHCIGVAIIGLPRWVFPTGHNTISLATEFCHYEGAVAYTLGLPMLVVVQEDVERRVVFDKSYRGHVGECAASADRTWLRTDKFRIPFTHWKRELSKRCDVFLGYCGSSTGIANNLKRFLESNEVGVSVLDWQADFQPAVSILQRIQEAAGRCSAGIFLFTQDDKLTDGIDVEKAVPRDNVVFEAGYFINAKGKDHVLIIREDGAKMPADLGGDIYAPLKDRSNIGPVENAIKAFVKSW
jgi:hypothetical protein